MLLREQGGRHQHGDLLAGRHRDERGAQRHLGLAEADVAADDPVHGLVGLEVAQHLFDGGGLVGGFLEWEAGLKRAIFTLAGRHPAALPRRAPGVEVQQFSGYVADALRRLAARFLPLFAAELVQRCGLRRRPRVTRDEVQRLHGHVQFVSVGIVEHEKLAGVAGHVHGLQADVPSDSVGFVDHRRADPQIGQLLEYLRRVALGAPSPAFLPRTIAEQLRLGKNLQGRRFQAQSRYRGRHGDAEVLAGGDEAREGVEYLCLNAAAAQQVEQHFAASRGLGREQNRAWPAARYASSSAAGCSARASMRTEAGAALAKF